MNHGKATIDRILTFLLGVSFAGFATWGVGLAYDAAFAHQISDFLNRDFWINLPNQDNYPNILRATALILGLLGFFLILLNIERKRLHRTTSPASGSAGIIRIHPADISSAVAQSLEALPGVRSATSKAIEDRSTAVLEIRLRISPEADIAMIRDACSEARENILAAIPGHDLRPRFLIDAEQVNRGNS